MSDDLRDSASAEWARQQGFADINALHNQDWLRRWEPPDPEWRDPPPADLALVLVFLFLPPLAWLACIGAIYGIALGVKALVGAFR